MAQIIKNFYCTLLLFFVLVQLSHAKTSTDVLSIKQLPEIKETVKQKITSERVVDSLLRSHFKKIDFNDALSEKIFDAYLTELDPQHNLLLRSDMAQFSGVKYYLADEIKSGNLETAYKLYNLIQERQLKYYQYLIEVLDHKLVVSDSNKHEFITDRQDAKWCENFNELYTLWYLRVKYDRLNLKLSGKAPDEISKILVRRYRTAILNLQKVTSEDVFQLFMNAVAKQIDPHTTYLSSQSSEDFRSSINLSLEGIGVTLGKNRDDETEVYSILPGGPASKSNLLRVGDLIVGVGQAENSLVDVVGWRLQDIINMIRGKKGTTVFLEIKPQGIVGKKTKIVELKRDKISLEDKRAKISYVDNEDQSKVGIITISSFYVGLTKDVREILNQALASRSFTSLIIDLRGNGGGVLTEAIGLSELFLPPGPMVQVSDSYRKYVPKNIQQEKPLYMGPLVVLVNRYSASASEIFAAAVQDYGRGIIVGDNTYGKGTVQYHKSLNRIYDQYQNADLERLGALQLTVQKFYRVNGDSTQLKGVEPDIVLPMREDVAEIGEKYLPNALVWDQIASTQYDKLDKVRKFMPVLLAASEKRIAKDIEFKMLKEHIQYLDSMKEKDKNISLDYSTRLQQNKEHDSHVLKIVNYRLQKEDKKPLSSVEEIPREYEAPDIHLAEAANIAQDLARLENK